MSETGRNLQQVQNREKPAQSGSRDNRENQEKWLEYDLGAGGRWFKSNRPDQ
jgi:hypothetical protein